ncbi:MAG: DegT/DnrJ/EryC1/StrS family aminotransferase [Gammaproteobacteria bacterium]|nr:DegT/DnrJ/EryC1/StrS family aminotransferase [Gammaproteobacteria bacterium]
MSIPFVDLKSQYRRLQTSINARIGRVLEHGAYVMGPEIGELEARLSEFCGARHAIACSSGTDALLLGLMAYDIGPGDAVFTTPFTFFATAEAIALLGATPVFVDIDRRTFNIDPDRLEEAIDRVRQDGRLTVRGILPVNLFGLAPDYDRINRIAASSGLFVLEDAAQGFGGSYKGRDAGSLGDVSTTSFFPAKPLGCYGDGGAVFTSDDSLAEKIISLRIHGMGADKYDNVRIGINARMDSIQAAVLLSKLEIFPDEIRQRQRLAEQYDKALEGLVETPYIPEGYTSIWAQYSVLSDHREIIIEALAEHGIPVAVYYRTPCHLSAAFAYLGYEPGDLPVSEATANRIFSLPIHPYLESGLPERIASILRTAAAGS